MKLSFKDTFNNITEKYGLDKLYVNSGSVFIRRIFGLILSFLWIYTITNLFGADTYGFVSLGQVVISLSGIVFGLGIDALIIKLGSNNKHYNEGVFISDFLKKSVNIVFISSIICSLLIFFFRDAIAINIFKDARFSKYLLLISAFLLFYILHNTLVGFLSVRDEFNKYGNFYFLFPNACILIFVIAIYLMALPDYYIIGAYLISYGIFGLILLISILKLPKNLTEGISYKNILSISTPMMISTSFLFISNWTDTFMLGSMVSKSELGIYNVAFKLASLALIIIVTINTVLAPKIAKLYSENNITQIKIEVNKATRIITYLTLPFALVLILFRNYILGVFGEEFSSGSLALIIITIGMLLGAMAGSVGQILNMTSHQKQFRNFTIIGAVTNVGLNYILINSYGIEGAAVASLISGVLINILCLVYIKKEFNFYAFFKL